MHTIYLHNDDQELVAAKRAYSRSLLIGAGALAFVVVFGLIGHQDMQTEAMQHQADLENQMSVVCHAANAGACQALIHEIEKNPTKEVLSDGRGNYWTETK